MMRHLTLACLLLLVLLPAGTVGEPAPDLEKFRTDYATTDSRLRLDGTILSRKLFDEEAIGKARLHADTLRQMYLDAPLHRQTTAAILDQALWMFALDAGTGLSAAQVTQAASEAQVRLALLQVAQNQRIIELLEQIASRPAVPTRATPRAGK